jgi:hypothetical protein
MAVAMKNGGKAGEGNLARPLRVISSSNIVK